MPSSARFWVGTLAIALGLYSLSIGYRSFYCYAIALEIAGPVFSGPNIPGPASSAPSIDLLCSQTLGYLFQLVGGMVLAGAAAVLLVEVRKQYKASLQGTLVSSSLSSLLLGALSGLGGAFLAFLSFFYQVRTVLIDAEGVNYGFPITWMSQGAGFGVVPRITPPTIRYEAFAIDMVLFTLLLLWLAHGIVFLTKGMTRIRSSSIEPKYHG